MDIRQETDPHSSNRCDRIEAGNRVFASVCLVHYRWKPRYSHGSYSPRRLQVIVRPVGVRRISCDRSLGLRRRFPGHDHRW
jgi:hypothetical protein